MSDNEDPVAKDQQKIVLMAAILIVVFLIVISIYGIATNRNQLEHPDAWVRYISHYQSLIGGLLAVAAAFITIRQMRKSDLAASDRHVKMLKHEMQSKREAILVAKVEMDDWKIELDTEIASIEKNIDNLETKVGDDASFNYWEEYGVILGNIDTLLDNTDTYNDKLSSELDTVLIGPVFTTALLSGRRQLNDARESLKSIDGIEELVSNGSVMKLTHLEKLRFPVTKVQTTISHYIKILDILVEKNDELLKL